MQSDALNEVVGVVGLGYVGLPLSMQILKSGRSVIGIDINLAHIESLQNGKTDIEGVEIELLTSSLDKGAFLATSDFSEIKKCDVVIITVPTPLDKNEKPDLDYLKSASFQVAMNVTKDTLIINESTSFPGTLREVIYPIFAQHAPQMVDTLDFSCSPERVDPGNPSFGFHNTPRNVSGLTRKSIERTRDFYSSFVNQVNTVETPEIAELAKLIENSYRLINIAFINELKEYCHVKGISLIQAIEAASTKPYGYSAFFPSAGVGGHCIPVDPVYLITSAESHGIVLETLKSAYDANLSLSQKVVKICASLLGELKGKKVLVHGVAYKSNIADTRESPSLRIFEELESLGAHVEWVDEIVQHWKGRSAENGIEWFDLVILCVAHKGTNLENIVSQAKLVVDLTGRLPNLENVITF